MLPAHFRAPKKKGRSKKGLVAEEAATEAVAHPEAALSTQDCDAFGKLEQIIHISREAPTIQLFDAIWQLAFSWLQTKSPKAAEYLRTTYFQKVSVDSLQKGLSCTSTLWGADGLWFGGFWGGILGTYPGTSSGTQPLESFHSYWQDTVKGQLRQSPAEVFGAMEKLFENDWATKFAWGEEKVVVTWPAGSAEALFNSQSLRSAGRSPAVDFWLNREPRLCQNRNYRQVHIRTGEPSSTSKDGITTFWVLQTKAREKLTAAEAIVTKEVAEMVGNLIASEGPQLATWLAKSGIVTNDQLDVAQLHKYLQGYCAVLEGHLVHASWPRVHRKLKKAVPGRLCTCREFIADCEHVLYIKALHGDPTANLQNIPVQRPRGRKRKR